MRENLRESGSIVTRLLLDYTEILTILYLISNKNEK